MFELVDKDSSSTEKILKCVACKKINDRLYNINVKNFDYKTLPGCKQPKWFGNMKSNLIAHLKREVHVKAAENHFTELRLLTDKRKEIMKVMEYLAYFAIKTSMSFDDYPKLLATVNRSVLWLSKIYDIDMSNIHYYFILILKNHIFYAHEYLSVVISMLYISILINYQIYLDL